MCADVLGKPAALGHQSWAAVAVGGGVGGELAWGPVGAVSLGGRSSRLPASVMVSQARTRVKTHKILHFKYVKFVHVSINPRKICTSCPVAGAGRLPQPGGRMGMAVFPPRKASSGDPHASTASTGRSEVDLGHGPESTSLASDLWGEQGKQSQLMPLAPNPALQETSYESARCFSRQGIGPHLPPGECGDLAA